MRPHDRPALMALVSCAPTMSDRALVHIGTHKTGTTSLQRWIDEHRDALARDRSVAVDEGLYGPNHIELALLCLRANRTSPAKQRIVVESRLDEWRSRAAEHLRRQAARDEPALLLSCEDLSLLRHTDEVEAL